MTSRWLPISWFFRNPTHEQRRFRRHDCLRWRCLPIRESSGACPRSCCWSKARRQRRTSGKSRTGIEDLLWVAALKPNNIGVPPFRDGVREYLEIAVLTTTLRDNAKSTRLTELIHRAIPYPVVLVSVQADSQSLSLAHKRWSQGEAGAVVIEEVRRTASVRLDAPSECEEAFLASLALSGLHARDLYTLYQGWLDRVTALQAASITGKFTLPESSRLCCRPTGGARRSRSPASRYRQPSRAGGARDADEPPGGTQPTDQAARG